LDYGVEWCENKLLAEVGQETKVDFVRNVLSQMSHSFPGLRRVQKHMEKVEVQPGEYLIRQGEKSNDLFFIESGLFAVEFETADGKKIRLRTVESGATVGEINLYLGGMRSASVKAEHPSIAYRLTAKTLHKLRQDDPALAALLHEWLGHLFAERLANNNRMLEFFLD
jgi:SulP family sulfate permease